MSTSGCRACEITDYIYSIACSPNGWTDSEVGVAWLKDIFDPETKDRVRGDKRLLIVDGHNSHCTLEFLLYAINCGIIVLCLPPHTTHVFQPLDVGIFGPLALEWSKAVNALKNKGYKITKNNFLSYYHQAREPVFTPERIASAFKKCGIWPLDRGVITDWDTAPSDNTTSQASQPLPAVLPAFLAPIPIGPCNPGTESIDPIGSISPEDDIEPQIIYSYLQLDRPVLPQSNASKPELHAIIQVLNGQLDRATQQMGADHAQMKLMDKENGRIRARLYGKTAKRGKVIHLNTGSRILTEQKQLNALIDAEKKKNWGSMMKGAGPILKARKKVLDARMKEQETAINDAEKRRVSTAEGDMKALLTDMQALVTKQRYLMGMLEKAEQALTKARRPSDMAAAEKRIDRWEGDIVILDEKMMTLQPELDAVTAVYDAVQLTRSSRLAATAEVEKRYMDAIALEKAENEISEKRDAERVARRAKLPQMPKDPLNLWKERWESEDYDEELAPVDIPDYFLGANDLRVPYGWYFGQAEEEEAEHEEQVNVGTFPAALYDIPIDPQLL